MAVTVTKTAAERAPSNAFARISSERGLFGLAVAAIGVHVVTDAFVMLEPGTKRADHVVSAAVPLAPLLLIVGVYPRLRPGTLALNAILLGALSLAGFGVAYRHATAVAPRGDDWTGFALLPAGLVLLVLGSRMLWRSRKRKGHRYLRRALLAVAAVLATLWIVVPTTVALLTTHRPREAAEPIDVGRRYESVVVRTSDGLNLDGRYVPSRNGAAVIVFPGSNSRAPQARALVRHGYGVLMLDMRGYRKSDGDPNAFGWGATKDIDAGIAFLQGRDDVDAGRIGGIGFSVGGEQMLEAAASNADLRAVVSDGAGERSVRESMLRGARGWFALPTMAVQTVAVTIFSGETPPPSLQDILPKIAPRPILLVYAGHGTGGEDLQPDFYAAAEEPKALWKIADAGHTSGFSAHPRAYERRVITFFDRALLRTRGEHEPQKG